MKIIPAIDLMEGKVVRLYKGDPEKKTIYSENPIDIAKKWEKAGADMIHLVDLDAALGRGSNMDIIKNLVNQVSVPVQVAGGLRDESTISKVLSFASRVVLGTMAFTEREILKKILGNYGKKRIVISVDHIDDIIKVKQNNAYGVILGKALYENLISIEEAKKIS